MEFFIQTFSAGEETERKLLDWVLDEAKRGFPLTKNSLLYSVKLLVQECYDKSTLPFTNGIPGEKWYRSFLKRHPIVVQKCSEYLSTSRASVTEAGIRAWFDKVSTLLGSDIEILNHPDQLYNMDESAFFLNSNGKVVLAERGRAVYDINQNSDKDSSTVSLCISASGEIAPTLIIYKFLRLPAVYGSTLPPDWSVGTSDTGWMNGELFYEYFANVFIPYKMKKHGDKKIIVFFDGHRSHLTLQVSHLARENGIILICFYPNTTHICQPEDVSVFKMFKLYWKKERDLFEFQQKRNIFKYEIPKILQMIFDKYPVSKSIINGFRKCGLFPWSADAVDYSKCKSNTTNICNTPATPLPQSQIILDLFESKIDANVLKEFRDNPIDLCWEGDQKYAALFDVWKSLLKDDQSYKNISTVST